MSLPAHYRRGTRARQQDVHRLAVVLERENATVRRCAGHSGHGSAPARRWPTSLADHRAGRDQACAPCLPFRAPEPEPMSRACTYSPTPPYRVLTGSGEHAAAQRLAPPCAPLRRRSCFGPRLDPLPSRIPCLDARDREESDGGAPVAGILAGGEPSPVQAPPLHLSL